MKNAILESLPENEFALIAGNMRHFSLEIGERISAVGREESIYFLDEGLVSILVGSKEKDLVEIGLVGSEGVLHYDLVVGNGRSSSVAQVEIPASGQFVNAEAAKNLLSQCPQFQKNLFVFSVIFSDQVSQGLACDQLHGPIERLGKWLVFAADLAGNHEFRLRFDLLQKLSAPRGGRFKEAVAELEKRSLLTSADNHLKILDYGAVDELACECAAILKRRYRELNDLYREEAG